jgi:hypothetical protein
MVKAQPREVATNPIQVPVSARDKQSSFVPGMVRPREIATNPIQVPVPARDKQSSFVYQEW